MSEPDDFDPARIGIQLDRAEEAGLIETDVAEQLRRLAGPIRLPMPSTLTEQPRFPDPTRLELEWSDGTRMVGEPVRVTELEASVDYVFRAFGREFVFGVSRDMASPAAFTRLRVTSGPEGSTRTYSVVPPPQTPTAPPS